MNLGTLLPLGYLIAAFFIVPKLPPRKIGPEKAPIRLGEGASILLLNALMNLTMLGFGVAVLLHMILG